MSTRRVQLDLDPPRVLAAWPAGQPLAALWSGDAPASRWTILARPHRPAIAAEARERLSRPLVAASADGGPPFTGGLIGAISYDAGRILEPAAQGTTRPPDDRRWPDHLWLLCPDALVHDALTGDWWSVGDGDSIIESLHPTEPRPFTTGDLRSSMSAATYIAATDRVLEYIRAGDVYQVNLTHRLTADFQGSARALWAALLAAARPRYGAYLEADLGPRRLALASASPEMFLTFDPHTRRLSTRPMKGTRPATNGAHADLDASPKDRAELAMIVDLMRNDLGRVCDLGSVSVDTPREIERHGVHHGDTEGHGEERQRRGEVRVDSSHAASFGEHGRDFIHSPSCPASSSPSVSSVKSVVSASSSVPLRVSVVNPSLLQATALVSGQLREGASTLDIFRATFPGGSITGAPKVRAMQIIDELESTPRGPYCGAIGFVSDSGHIAFNIAIRTAALSGTPSGPARDDIRGHLDWGIGAGIVAESNPEHEWQETLDKAGVLRAALTHTALRPPLSVL